MAAVFVGHFMSWAQHKTAALSLTGHDLGYFTALTPGAGVFLHGWFFLPVCCVAVIIALSNSRPISLRAGLILKTLAALLIASLALPKYPDILRAYRAPPQGAVDLRPEFYMGLMTMALVVALTLVAHRLTPRQRTRAYGLALLPVLVPMVGFLMVRPFIIDLYRDAVTLGVGWWITIIGFCTAELSIIWRIFWHKNA